MTNTPSTQPSGWYYAQGDPPGTQRYWDGTQWVGGPQAAQAGAPADAQAATPAQQYNPSAQPDYSYGAASSGGNGAPAEYGTRVVAALIDFGISLGIFIVLFLISVVLTLINDGLGFAFGVIGYLGVVLFGLWNTVIRQGQTGQTIGKGKKNISLVADATRRPVGVGMALLRYLIPSFLSFTIVYPLLDILWPLWDEEKKRLTDKMLKFSVVQN